MSESVSPQERYKMIARWFEQLTLKSLDTIDTIYSPSAAFSDPFNDVVGIDRVKAVYAHMFATLDNPRFVLDRILTEDMSAFVLWTFEFQLSGQSHRIAGVTHFELDDHGLVTLHRDYWDAAKPPEGLNLTKANSFARVWRLLLLLLV